MSHIFLSYSSSDRQRVLPIVKELEKYGLSIWWDRRIPPGKTFDEIIEVALEDANCVLVVWSNESVKSSWVKTEAAEGLHRNILVPILIDRIKIPLEFRRIQAADLVGWNGEARHPELVSLLNSISSVTRQSLKPSSGGEAALTKIEPPGTTADTGGATLSPPLPSVRFSSSADGEDSGTFRESTDATFESDVLDSQKPTLVNFYAPWSAPDRMLAPTLAQLAVEFRGKVRFVRINADEHPASAQRYGIKGVPTVIVFLHGEEKERIVGAGSKESYFRMLGKYLTS